ncbi:unnamed protein product [Peniophora sp. CBMAI 1063]|nr:unnamed protein product [Peniophora sp. CBMAI 1063]
MSALLRTSVARAALRATPASRRSLVTLKERLYEVEGIADSAGRNGTVTSPQSKSLTLKMSTPKSLGGAEDAHNPEQLFAMGYAACFSGALNLVAGQQGKKDAVKNAKIHVTVALGKRADAEGFGLEADIKVTGVEDKSLVEKAHEVCPYSVLMRETCKSTLHL